MRAVPVAIVALVVLGCQATASPATSPANFFVTVANVNGPPVEVTINGSSIGQMSCGDPGVTIIAGESNAPALPWIVSIVASDGTQLAQTTFDGSTSHILEILDDGAYLDGPTPNPGMYPRRPCPSMYFKTAVP